MLPGRGSARLDNAIDCNPTKTITPEESTGNSSFEQSSVRGVAAARSAAATIIILSSPVSDWSL
jgi:hypothetical protein